MDGVLLCVMQMARLLVLVPGEYHMYSVFDPFWFVNKLFEPIRLITPSWSNYLEKKPHALEGRENKLN